MIEKCLCCGNTNFAKEGFLIVDDDEIYESRIMYDRYFGGETLKAYKCESCGYIMLFAENNNK